MQPVVLLLILQKECGYLPYRFSIRIIILKTIPFELYILQGHENLPLT